MPSPVIIEIEFDQSKEYLVPFCETIWGRPDKPQPIFFNKDVGKFYNKFLNQFLENPKKTMPPRIFAGPTLKILLPYFETKDVRSYWWLPPKHEKMLVKMIAAYFDFLFDQEAFQLVQFLRKKKYDHETKKQIIDHFMNVYNLPADCIDFLQKRYVRLLRNRTPKFFAFKEKISSFSGTVFSNVDEIDEDTIIATFEQYDKIV